MINKFTKYIAENEEKKFNAIQSFHLKDELNPEVWDGEVMKPEISEQLLKISSDFMDTIETDNLTINVVDVILTGSNCNYNWSQYSDFDLHIMVDFNDLDSDDEVIKLMFSNATKVWQAQHDIEIEGYTVELYVQSTDEEHVSSGQYSLINSEWIVKPSKIDFKPDEVLIKKKATKFMDIIDDIEEKFNNAENIEVVDDDIKIIWKKIKDSRKAGLNEDGEYSIENLVFKLLRRNGYIEKLIDIKTKNYDKQFK